MPIRVTCQCGASLSIPDAMAGKTGKCPKCSQPLKIPSAAMAGDEKKTTSKPNAPNPLAVAASPANKSPANKSPGGKPSAGNSPAGKTQSTSAAAPPGGLLDQLFADAGLDKQPAATCPNCKTEILPGTTLCVSCGLNLATGEKVKGFSVELEEEEGPKFKNYQLNRAARSIKKEAAEEEELRFVGAPWWVSLAIVLGMITIIVFGVIYVEGLGSNSEGGSFKASAKTFEGRIQRLPPQNLLIVVCFLVTSMVVIMATIAIQIKAFQRKLKSGFMCFIPGYVQYYSIANRKRLRSTTKILWIWTVLFIIFAVLLFTSRSYRVFSG